MLATPWHAVHWVNELIVPVVQLGVVFPPWQLVAEQVRADGVKVAAPLLALKVVAMLTVAGAVGVVTR